MTMGILALVSLLALAGCGLPGASLTRTKSVATNSGSLVSGTRSM